ncbi:hypothetical protein PoB_002110800 [Plakobranchus ocellatus]|uniref:Uncharacterized protein n=1 Tax=Plakobranchus ocellatus TaxID=259542 RepID=A0AAV3ZJC7_9GAST|nr:hypothetical protein PoB_002110800 [Plakobranchus ocellatus]
MEFSLSQRALVVLAVIICTMTQYAKTDSSQETQPQARASSPEIKVCYNVQSIERNPTTDGNIFTVTFTSDVEDLSLAYCINYTCKIPSPRRVLPGRSCMFSFKVPHDAPIAYVIFSTKGEYHRYMEIKLDNNGTESMSETLDSTELQDVLINPPEEAVYNPGEDVTVKVDSQYPIDQTRTSPLNRTRIAGWRSVLCDIEKKKLLEDRWPRDLIKLVPEPPEDEYENLNGSMTFIIKTSTRPMSGFLSFIQLLYSHLIMRLTLAQVYVVRPAHQNGPYPDGFIYVYSKPNASCK